MPATVTDIGADDEARISDLTRVEDYIRTGKCKHEYQGEPVLRDTADDPFLYRDGEFIMLQEECKDGGDDCAAITIVTRKALSSAGGLRTKLETYDGTSVVVPAGVLVSGGPRGKNTLIIAGDEDFSAIEVSDSTPAITISFLCLSRFLDDAEPLAIAAMLHSGKIKVLDFTEDETRKVSDGDKKKYEDKKPVAPPELGFTYMQSNSPVWHRAATVLLKFGRMRILLGQDDDTYFGCELKGVPDTVKEAFKSLVPEHIRRVKGVKRQGEWFIVPVAEKNVPAVTECAATTCDSIDLPVDDEESARHTVTSNDIRVARDGRIYANRASLCHGLGDHPDVDMLAGWYTFDRNTAKRSFSQEGVD